MCYIWTSEKIGTRTCYVNRLISYVPNTNGTTFSNNAAKFIVYALEIKIKIQTTDAKMLNYKFTNADWTAAVATFITGNTQMPVLMSRKRSVPFKLHTSTYFCDRQKFTIDEPTLTFHNSFLLWMLLQAISESEPNDVFVVALLIFTVNSPRVFSWLPLRGTALPALTLFNLSGKDSSLFDWPEGVVNGADGFGILFDLIGACLVKRLSSRWSSLFWGGVIVAAINCWDITGDFSSTSSTTRFVLLLEELFSSCVVSLNGKRR